MLRPLTARADDPNTIVFRETFDQTGGTGGQDGVFSGNSIANNALTYDNEEGGQPLDVLPTARRQYAVDNRP